MSGLGAIVKAVESWVKGALDAADRGLRLASGDPEPKLCPIYVKDRTKNRRRRDSV